jgi:2-oxoglutarate dehydrogenase E1 component
MSYYGRGNAEYIESLYNDYQKDPQKVDVEWRRFFEGLEVGMKRDVSASSSDSVIDLLRENAHLFADLDPLKVKKISPDDLLKFLDLKTEDLKGKVTDKILSSKGITELKAAFDFLKKTYCGTLTVELRGLSKADRAFFIEKFELEGVQPQLSNEERKLKLHEITSVEAMEKFLHTRFVGMKRFSIEGTDTGVVLLETILQKAPIEEMVIGMAHRGRINVLTNFMGKAIKTVLAEFDGKVDPGDGSDSGDVKYHMGFSTDRDTATGRKHISLAFNPSHLEFVGPVVQGVAWAKQRRKKDKTGNSVLPIMIHGDASFAGQGVVYETLQMATLESYDVGGTIHIIFDNQVGFTANPMDSRCTTYSSDLAKTFNMPVIHVNADDLEACVRAAEIATAYRFKFNKDVLIRLNGYRRFGHNEGDEPAYTQPLMYDIVKKQPTVREIYGKKLVSLGVMTQAEVDKKLNDKIEQLQSVLDEVRKGFTPPGEQPFGGTWVGLRKVKSEADMFKVFDTSAKKEVLAKTIKAMCNPPKDFNWNAKLEKQFKKTEETFEKEGHLNWSMAEMCAYGSLISEGTSVRLLGQDGIRGTFSHRHAKYIDQKNESLYSPLSQINPGKADIEIYNSFLSETAALAFEYGVSSADPSVLTIWEAQFGDFANGAQVIIDQFLVAGEAKWNRMSGLVMLLPHGYEGQGPEHSSARLERFLNLCTNQNIQVCNPTTPAQIFHLLRRQLKRDFRKPLIIMSPKSLLRHPKVISDVKEFTDSKTSFKEIIGDSEVSASAVKELLLCTGKVYYDLIEAREKAGVKDRAIVRLEQIYPYPDAEVRSLIQSYKNLKSLKWVQEEPRNMGAYRFVSSYVWQMLKDINIDFKYVGRVASASPATGSPRRHAAEQEAIMKEAFGLK